jgi:two-component system nitrate/nitrite sensor histidine kinase NarX
VEQASAEVRRAIASLQQDPQRPQSLQERLTGLVAGLPQDGGPVVDLALPSHDPLLLPPGACEEVLRVVGEALLNSRRHAGARRVAVRLEQAGSEAVVTVEDDGQGFDPAAPPAGGRHFGLSIMRARAARLGGCVAVISEPGRGTRVTLTWPVGGG